MENRPTPASLSTPYATVSENSLYLPLPVACTCQKLPILTLRQIGGRDLMWVMYGQRSTTICFLKCIHCAMVFDGLVGRMLCPNYLASFVLSAPCKLFWGEFVNFCGLSRMIAFNPSTRAEGNLEGNLQSHF